MNGYIFNCNKCGSQNELFRFICKKCGHTFHNKIANIEFTSALTKLIESPRSGFEEIIQAENKNFIWIVFSIFSIKLLINIHLLFPVEVYGNIFNLFQQMVLSLLVAVFLAFTFAIVIKKVTAKKVEIRIRDLLAVISYSQFPLLFGLIILFPLEIVLFGEFLFSRNPSPFFVRPTFAYLFSVFEVAILFWQLTIMSIGLNLLGNNKTAMITFSLLYLIMTHLLLFAILFFAR